MLPVRYCWIETQCDIHNPLTDKRSRGSWLNRPIIEAGTRFFVEQWPDIDDHYSPPELYKMTIQPNGGVEFADEDFPCQVRFSERNWMKHQIFSNSIEVEPTLKEVLRRISACPTLTYMAENSLIGMGLRQLSKTDLLQIYQMTRSANEKCELVKISGFTLGTITVPKGAESPA